MLRIEYGRKRGSWSKSPCYLGTCADKDSAPHGCFLDSLGKQGRIAWHTCFEQADCYDWKGSIPQEGCAVFRNWQCRKSTSVSNSVFPSSLASHDVS